MQSNNSSFPSIKELDQYLTGFFQDGCEYWRKENEHYLQAHMQRFHATLAAIPKGKPGEKLLELGASPYFMTLALHHYCNYTIYLSDGVKNNHPEEASVKLVKRDSCEEYDFTCQSFNVEIDCFPYPDNSFNFVLCSELIEHLALDPTHMLYEIHRILRPGGKVLITTPNVLVLRNLVSLIKHKRNIYYPYSGYGVYGRHNREWTLEELVQLLKGCGFSIENAQIVDTYPHRGYSKVLKSFYPFLRDMLVVTGCAENEPVKFYPENLYESYPKQ
jgi:ubiquinone/menaquinone biosynthesis C-methylase UbiE